jgi:Ni,Fe-hydrogenase I large subunit
MSELAGHLAIRIEVASAAVTIRSSRVLAATRVFAGKPPDEVARQLPMLFSLCGTAQAVACADACERALGLTAEEPVRQRRQQLVQAETIKEHLWRLLLDWPKVMAPTVVQAARPSPAMPAMAQVMQHFVSLRQAAGEGADADPLRPRWSGPERSGLGVALLEAGRRDAAGPAAAALCDFAGLVREYALQSDPADWLAAVDSTDALMRWAEGATTTPAQLVRTLMAEGLAGCGANPVPRLAGMPVDGLEQRLACPDAEAFVAAPQWQGGCRETSPLSRAASHPLVVALLADLGNGLLTRLAALLVELGWAAASLQSAAGDSVDATTASKTAESDRVLAPAAEPLMEPVATSGASAGLDFGATGLGPDAAEVGIGLSEASRGLLVHRVVIADALVQRYQVVAPTEWNFHPKGVVAQGLAAIARSGVSIAELERLAHLYITAVDPCVEYQLSVS